MSTHNIPFSIIKRNSSLIILKLQLWKYQGTQGRVRNSRGKRATSVRTTEGLLFLPWRKRVGSLSKNCWKRANQHLSFPTSWVFSQITPQLYLLNIWNFVWFGWLVVWGLTALWDSISVYIGPSPKEREKKERIDRREKKCPNIPHPYCKRSNTMILGRPGTGSLPRIPDHPRNFVWICVSITRVE